MLLLVCPKKFDVDKYSTAGSLIIFVWTRTPVTNNTCMLYIYKRTNGPRHKTCMDERAAYYVRGQPYVCARPLGADCALAVRWPRARLCMWAAGSMRNLMFFSITTISTCLFFGHKHQAKT